MKAMCRMLTHISVEMLAGTDPVGVVDGAVRNPSPQRVVLVCDADYHPMKRGQQSLPALQPGASEFVRALIKLVGGGTRPFLLRKVVNPWADSVWGRPAKDERDRSVKVERVVFRDRSDMVEAGYAGLAKRHPLKFYVDERQFVQ